MVQSPWADGRSVDPPVSNRLPLLSGRRGNPGFGRSERGVRPPTGRPRAPPIQTKGSEGEGLYRNARAVTSAKGLIPIF